MRREPDEKIVLDIDRDRIKSILSETYTICTDMLRTQFDISRDQFVAQIDPYLESNRIVHVPVFISLPSRRYPEMRIRVNIQKKKVLAFMYPKSKQVLVNRGLKVL